jgi:hypothetical protein
MNFLLGLALTLTPAAPPSPYVVLVDPGPGDQYLAAATRLAKIHDAEVVRFDPAKLDDAFADLAKRKPDRVAFVLPPGKIDVDLAHEILARSTRLDADPFPDFEYAFITGRDGKAAERFVERIEAAWARTYGRKVTLFGSWEGMFPPSPNPPSAFKAMGADAVMKFTRTRDAEADRAKAATAGLAACRDRDLLLFFSHGFPDEMAACFKAPDLKDWKADGAVLVNCACYNGAPGRWFAPGPTGPKDMGVVRPEASVCLAILDSGVSAYVAGIDPWHGPLAFQMTGHLFDDGLSLGAAARAMHDRLALAFRPDPIAFAPTLKDPKRFAGEGQGNRRYNGAGMIVYGDPAFAPFAKTASRLVAADLEPADDKLRMKVRVAKQLDGQPAEDFFLPLSRFLDYYSVKTADVIKEARLEIYRVVDLPKRETRTPELKVTAAKCGAEDVPTKAPEVVVEETPRGRRLHVRVPLDAAAYGSAWPMKIVQNGLTIELNGLWTR